MKLAALVYSSFTVPGDQRSRDYPGHGYPEHTETTISLREFRDEAEMAEWVKRETTRGYSSSKFTLIRYEELTYDTKIDIH